jgi:hypothetical protein
LIRLGKVTEHDIRLTFAAFRRLDVANEGVLNSKSIIGGMILKCRGAQLNQSHSGNWSRTGRRRGRRPNRQRAEHQDYAPNRRYTDSVGSSNRNDGMSWRSIGSWIHPMAPDTRFDSGISSITSPTSAFQSDRTSVHSERAPLMFGSQAPIPYGEVMSMARSTE